MLTALFLFACVSFSAVQERYEPPRIPTRVTVSEAASAKQIVKRVNPTYPADAQAQCIQGKVTLSVIIAKDGHVKSARATGGPIQLRRAAEDAVQEWEYAPYLLNGRAVEQETTATVRFRLPSMRCPPGKIRYNRESFYPGSQKASKNHAESFADIRDVVVCRSSFVCGGGGTGAARQAACHAGRQTRRA